MTATLSPIADAVFTSNAGSSYTLRAGTLTIVRRDGHPLGNSTHQSVFLDHLLVWPDGTYQVVFELPGRGRLTSGAVPYDQCVLLPPKVERRRLGRATPNCTDECARIAARGIHICSVSCLCH